MTLIFDTSKTKEVRDNESVFSLFGGRLEIFRDKKIRLQKRLTGKILKEVAKRYRTFFGEEIDKHFLQNIWYSEVGDNPGYTLATEGVILVKEEPPDEISDTICHEFGHLRYNTDVSKVCLDFGIPFLPFSIGVDSNPSELLEEIAACYFELMTSEYTWEFNSDEDGNREYGIAQALIDSEVDKSVVWRTLVKSNSLEKLLERLNGNLHPSAKRLLLDISKK